VEKAPRVVVLVVDLGSRIMQAARTSGIPGIARGKKGQFGG
jgi:hypothetical protein